MTPVTPRSLRLLGTGAAVLFFAACADNDATAPAPASSQKVATAALTPIPGRYVVIMKEGQRSGLHSATAAVAQQFESGSAEAGVAVMRNLSAAQVSALASQPGVEAVVPDVSAQWLPPAGNVRLLADGDVSTEGTDQSGASLYSLQWNMHVIQAQSAWAATPGGAGKLVCVLDTGVDPSHQELANKLDVMISKNTDTSFPGNQDPFDYHFHGTFVSSQVSTNGIRIASVAPDVRLCSIKVLGVTGSGSFGDIINAIFTAVDTYRADVINMSLGAYVNREAPGVAALIAALQAAVDHATSRGTLVVASAGNNGVNLDEDSKIAMAIPAQLRNVVSVGATAPYQQQNFDMLASYSAFGGRTGIDLVAPGGDLLAGGNSFDLVLGACSTLAAASIGIQCGVTSLLLGSGTSFASPLVAGAGAVVESQFGNLSPAALERCLLRGTDVVGSFRIFGAGRLNVAKAATCP